MDETRRFRLQVLRPARDNQGRQQPTICSPAYAALLGRGPTSDCELQLETLRGRTNVDPLLYVSVNSRAQNLVSATV